MEMLALGYPDQTPTTPPRDDYRSHLREIP